MRKVLVTGGSGFVGTNLVAHCIERGWEVRNLDIVRPRNPEHLPYWQHGDIRDAESVHEACRAFAPTDILHMAARTDLDGRSQLDYAANTDGVRNMIQAAAELPNLKRIIFASSMLVCRLGYHPSDEFDFAPDTVYGQSKVIGEQLVRELATGRLPWTIVRPTSLWGPWFQVPYRDFFTAVHRRRYIHPKGWRIRRSYGFVLNTVHQIEKILNCPDSALVNDKVFYLADYEPIELLHWARLIGRQFGVPPPKEVPLTILKGLALCGDLLKSAGMKRVPITSTRLRNLLTEAVYDLGPLYEIAGNTPHSLETAVETTVNWMKMQRS